MSALGNLALWVGGGTLVAATLLSAINTLVLPRGVRSRMTQTVFIMVRSTIDVLTRHVGPIRRDSALALVAPLGLMLLPVLWLVLVGIGYTAIYLGAGVDGYWDAIHLSGSSMLTLGFIVPETNTHTLLAFSQATIGLGLVTLLIAYLPTMYAAFSQRETEVALLEVRAGTPPSAVVMLTRFKAIDSDLSSIWERFEVWFAHLDETHTSLAALPLFRSPSPTRSWVTAAGTVLDAAALQHSTIEGGKQPDAALCLRGGFTTLRRICDLYGIPYHRDPQPGDPISLTRDEFDDACHGLEEAGYDLVADRDQAWLDFSGWRVNYDEPLLALAMLLEAPFAPWTADRSPSLGRPTLARPRGTRVR